MALIISLITIISTFLGGLFALKFKDKLHLILGFSAGAVVGVAFFDLAPEAITLAKSAYDIRTVTLLFAVGFIIYMLFDRFFVIHGHDDHCENPKHNGKLGALTLCIHSFLDGLGIGLAFKVSPAVGWIVAAAVLAHDFSDGINTVNMILKSHGNKKTAITWLVFDALAPAIGVMTALFINISEPVLGLCLAIFAGLFFYIGASDLIPESHHQHPTFYTTSMTILGMAVLDLIIRMAGQ